MGEIGDHFRDVREHRKRERSEQSANADNTSSRRCWDWIVVSGSCHYARDRASFTTYTPLPNNFTVGGSPALGVGTVELYVRRGNIDTTKLVLDLVFHTPRAVCNGLNISNPHLCQPSHRTYNPGQQGAEDIYGVPLWYVEDFRGTSRLILAEHTPGISFLEEGTIYMLSINFSDEEKVRLQRWQFVEGGDALMWNARLGGL